MAGGALVRDFAAGAALVAGAALASASELVHSRASVKVRQKEGSGRIFIPARFGKNVD